MSHVEGREGAGRQMDGVGGPSLAFSRSSQHAVLREEEERWSRDRWSPAF